MKILARILSAVGLSLIFVPSCMYFFGAIDKPQMNWLMIIGTALWFLSAPLWIGATSPEETEV